MGTEADEEVAATLAAKYAAVMRDTEEQPLA